VSEVMREIVRAGEMSGRGMSEGEITKGTVLHSVSTTLTRRHLIADVTKQHVV